MPMLVDKLSYKIHQIAQARVFCHTHRSPKLRTQFSLFRILDDPFKQNQHVWVVYYFILNNAATTKL